MVDYVFAATTLRGVAIYRRVLDLTDRLLQGDIRGWGCMSWMGEGRLEGHT